MRSGNFTLMVTSTSLAVKLVAITVVAIALLFSASVATPPLVAKRSGVSLVAESSTRASFTFELPLLDHETVSHQGEQFDRFSLQDDPSAGPEGWPELPSMVRFVLIPPQSGVELAISNVRSHTISNVNPIPRQPLPDESEISLQQARNPFDNGAQLVRDSEAQKFEGMWPPEIARLGEPAIMRGYRIVPVVINPVRFDANSNELEIIDGFDFVLDFSSEANRKNLVANPSKPRPSATVDKLLRQIVVNPPLILERDLGERGGSILYVVGTGGNWNPIVERLAPLVEWRRKMGWTVGILRVNNPADVQNTKQRIQTYYDEAVVPPEHIVICGDTDRDFPIGFFDHRVGAQYPYESDHDYGMLEGDDILPEASVARFPFANADILEGIVNKTISYEADPYIGEGEAVGWQKRGALEALVPYTSPIDVCRWIKRTMLGHGYERVDELYFGDEGGDDNQAFVFGEFEEGLSLFIHRGPLFMNPNFHFSDVRNLRNGQMLPFVMIITCNTGDYGEHNSDGGHGYFNESFICNPDGGAIGAVGCAGATHTAYNNIYVTGVMKALMMDGITNQGWAHNAGKLMLYSHYFDRGDIMHEENRNMEGWLTQFYINNLMGDPAVDLFTDVPRALTVSAPEAIRRGDSRVEVSVVYADDEAPARDATVCLYKPDAFQLLAAPDAEGKVVFSLDPAWTEEDSIHLTITGHNLLTSRRSYLIDEERQLIAAGSYQIDDARGNGDGFANQMETIELTINVTNFGNNELEGALNLQLATSNPLLQVIEDRVDLQAVPLPDDSAPATFVVRILAGFPTGKNAVFDLTATFGEISWTSSVSITVAGPDLEIEELRWVGEPLRRGANAELAINLRNAGTVDVQPFRATLFSRVRTIGTIVANVDYDGIPHGESNEAADHFRASAHVFHFDGQQAPVGLAILSQDGYVDTLLFDLPLSDAVASEPFGNDGYGYICFDATDTGWYACPEFDWVEIDRAFGGPGTNTEMQDANNDNDHTVLVDLPFIFQYYGEEFDQLTICSNGWIAPGACDELTSARNRHIPGPECPPGLIAPFWEDLIIPDGSGVFTWHDEENDRFVVEWSRLKKLGPRNNNEPTETFQAILLDPEHHPSFTGDGDIIFQYLEITDDQSCIQTWDTPYASVGIASPDLSDGIEYIYWNELASGAAPLRDSLAITFTTLIDFRVGALRGRVYDAATRQPIAGADISISYGFSTLTENNGEFSIPEALVDSNYTFRASKQFYNDSVLVGMILEGEETVIEFGLLHPEFTLSDERKSFEMLPDSSSGSSITLRNSGNGPLTFSSKFGYELERDDPDEAWDLLARWGISDTVDNPRIQAVAWVRDHWLVAATRIGNEGQHLFYRFDKYGTPFDSLFQPDSIGGRFGIRHLEYENGNLWAVASDEFLYQLDPETGEVLHRRGTIDALDQIRCLTRDPETGYFYLGETTSSIYKVEIVNDTEIRFVEVFAADDPRDVSGLRKYGFGWYPDDPDGFNLYVNSSNEVPVNDADHADLALFKIHPVTKEVRYITDLADYVIPASGGKCGMTITTGWNRQVTTLAIIVEEAAHDWLGVFELGPNTSWISYEPKFGRLEAGQQVPIEIEVSSADLDTGSYSIFLDYSHNAAPGLHRVLVSMDVVEELSLEPDDESALAPLEFGLEHAFPNPFNSTTTIRFAIDAEARTSLKVYDLAGREVVTLANQVMKAGRYTASFKAEGLASGVYICRLESGEKRAVQKMLLMK